MSSPLEAVLDLVHLLVHIIQAVDKLVSTTKTLHQAGSRSPYADPSKQQWKTV